MVEVRATPARIALMQAIDDGAVCSTRSGLSRRPDFEVDLIGAGWPVSATRYRKATAEVTQFRDAGLVTCVSGGLVELTDRGRAWLKLRANCG